MKQCMMFKLLSFSNQKVLMSLYKKQNSTVKEIKFKKMTFFLYQNLKVTDDEFHSHVQKQPFQYFSLCVETMLIVRKKTETHDPSIETWKNITCINAQVN